MALVKSLDDKGVGGDGLGRQLCRGARLGLGTVAGRAGATRRQLTQRATDGKTVLGETEREATAANATSDGQEDGLGKAGHDAAAANTDSDGQEDSCVGEAG
jgi:hypothetical protein